MIDRIRRLLARLLQALPAPGPSAPSWTEPSAPEPVTDPLNPLWRPDGDYIPPLFYERAIPAPPTWTWTSFTDTWPTVR